MSWVRDTLGKAKYNVVAQEGDGKNEECVMNVDGQGLGIVLEQCCGATLKGDLPSCLPDTQKDVGKLWAPHLSWPCRALSKES